MKKIFIVWTTLVASFLLANTALAQSERQMYAAASALTKLSTAVDVTLRFRNPSTFLTDDQLLRLSTAHDSALLKPFDGFKLHVLRGESRGVVLVCDNAGARALLEDAACTPKLDRHHWRIKQSCEFTLDRQEACTR